MTDIIVLIVLLFILGGAACYVYRAKKSGKKCIGCPGGCSADAGGSCSGRCSSCSMQCSHRPDGEK